MSDQKPLTPHTSYEAVAQFVDAAEGFLKDCQRIQDKATSMVSDADGNLIPELTSEEACTALMKRVDEMSKEEIDQVVEAFDTPEAATLVKNGLNILDNLFSVHLLLAYKIQCLINELAPAMGGDEYTRSIGEAMMLAAALSGPRVTEKLARSKGDLLPVLMEMQRGAEYLHSQVPSGNTMQFLKRLADGALDNSTPTTDEEVSDDWH